MCESQHLREQYPDILEEVASPERVRLVADLHALSSADPPPALAAAMRRAVLEEPRAEVGKRPPGREDAVGSRESRRRGRSGLTALMPRGLSRAAGLALFTAIVAVIAVGLSVMLPRLRPDPDLAIGGRSVPTNNAVTLIATAAVVGPTPRDGGPTPVRGATQPQPSPRVTPPVIAAHTADCTGRKPARDRLPVTVEWEFWPRTLAEARERATAIVRARVVGVKRPPARLSPGGEDGVAGPRGEWVSLKVLETLKGEPGERISLYSDSTPIQYPPEDPPYAECEEYVLFLEPKRDEPGLWLVVSPLGRYRVVGGKLVPMTDDNFAGKLRGKSVEYLTEALTAAASKDGEAETYTIRGYISATGPVALPVRGRCEVGKRGLDPSLVLRDEEGRELGRPRYDPTTRPLREAGGCRLPYFISGLPRADTYNFYLFANSAVPYRSYTFAEMQRREWRVDFDLPMKRPPGPLVPETP